VNEVFELKGLAGLEVEVDREVHIIRVCLIATVPTDGLIYAEHSIVEEEVWLADLVIKIFIVGAAVVAHNGAKQIVEECIID
jgi:hypothetical protein